MKLSICLIALTCFFSSVKAETKITANSPVIKQLLPPDAVINNACPVELIEGLGHLTRWDDEPRCDAPCISTADLDMDGNNELVIVYSTPMPNSEMGLHAQPHPTNLVIYKQLKDKWALQYHYMGKEGASVFGVAKLLNTNATQIIFNSGLVSKELALIQYDGKEYKALIPNKKDTGNYAISIYDIDGDKEQEIMLHTVGLPLARIYKWNKKDKLFEIFTNTKILNSYYKLIIHNMQDLVDGWGAGWETYAWALFESYDKVGDADSAIKIGKKMLNSADHSRESIYCTWDIAAVMKRIAELEKQKGNTRKSD